MYVQKGKYKIISDEKESEWKDGDPDKPDQEKGDWNPQKEKPIQKERKSVKDKVKEIVNNAANRGMGSGGGSGALRKFVERLANPQINWRKILQRYVSTANEEPTMYKIPNRRYASQGIYLPGLRGKEEGFGSVVIAVDTSGSIGSEEYNTFLTEARSILKAFSPEEIWIIYCSDDIDGIDYLKYPTQKLDPSKQGSTGGNELGFDPPIKWAEDNILKKGKDLACLIYFTDGGAHDPEKPKWHKKIIWAMISSKQMPFGKHVNVPMKELKRKK
jgi:predicted metal-dependent peptidase